MLGHSQPHFLVLTQYQYTPDAVPTQTDGDIANITRKFPLIELLNAMLPIITRCTTTPVVAGSTARDPP